MHTNQTRLDSGLSIKKSWIGGEGETKRPRPCININFFNKSKVLLGLEKWSIILSVDINIVHAHI